MSKFTVVALSVATLLAAPSPAPAAVVEISGDTLTYRDTGAETNFPILATTSDGKLSISDSGADITQWPDPACAPSGDSTYLVCTMPGKYVAELGGGDDTHTFGDNLPGTLALDLRGGAGADRLEPWNRSDGSPVGGSRTVDGGDGDDKIVGSSGIDVLRGGPGNDTIDAYGGADVIDGGEGDDTLSGDRGDSDLAWASSFVGDTVDGGPGTDRFEDYFQGATGVSVTLDGVANDGRTGENDNLMGVEFVQSQAPGTYTGSEGADAFEIFYSTTGTVSVLKGLGGNDVLEGDHNAQQFDGGAGDDYLEGGYGDDTFVGGPGRDRIIGDEADGNCGGNGQSCVTPYGNDTIDVRDGEVDSVDCGFGSDRVIADADDVVAPNCEVVERSGGAGTGTGGGGTGAGGGAAAPAARCTVPRVVKLKQKAAIRKVRAAGCRAKIRRIKHRRIKTGRVVRTSPRAGTQKAAGAKVTIYVSRGRR